MDNYTKNINEGMQRAFEKQLHEQYAINNNNNISSVVTLFAALVVVFGGYGYLFIHSSVRFASDFSNLYCNCTKTYSLDAFLFCAMATLIVVAIMKYICLYQGANQRFEQFITYSLRCKYYQKLPINLVPKIYPSHYTPFKDLKDDKLAFVQGLFGELYKILSFIDFLIYFSITIKLFFNFKYYNFNWQQPHCRGIFEICLLIYLWAIIYGELSSEYNRLKMKYYRLCEEYSIYLNKQHKI